MAPLDPFFTTKVAGMQLATLLMKIESGKSFFLWILRKIFRIAFFLELLLGISSGKAALAKCIDQKILENSKHSRYAAVSSKTRSINFEVVYFPECRSWHEGVANLEHFDA